MSRERLLRSLTRGTIWARPAQAKRRVDSPVSRPASLRSKGPGGLSDGPFAKLLPGPAGAVKACGTQIVPKLTNFYKSAKEKGRR